MPASPHAPSFITSVESLEPRRLFAGEPWGTIPQLIDQDDAASRYSSLTGKGQTIAVIDTGIDYTHPALGGGFGTGQKVVAGYDFVDDDDDPMDTYGHGTGVAGVIGADEFVLNGRTYRGIAPQARLVALRIDESNEPVPDERIEEALDWVIAKRRTFGITVVNISFGYGSFADAEVSPIFGDELKALKDAGVFIVASSGNNGVSDPPGIQYPAADPSVFAVGSVDEFNTISEFTERSDQLDMLAPGADVATTALNDDDDTTEDFRFATGTSFASPFVAGTAALMRQADASLRPADIRSILRVSAVDTKDGDDEFGAFTTLTFPRLHVEHALELTYDRKGGSLGSSDALVTDGNDSSLAYDRDGILHVVYYHAAKRRLEHVVRATDGGWSNPKTVDGSAADLGCYSSMKLDASGRPAVAYFDATVGDLKFARYDGDNWIVSTIDAPGIAGLYPSLVFDKDGNPAVSYYHKTKGDLRVARHDGSEWIISTVDSNSDVGRHTTMAMDSGGRLAIAYDNTTNGSLKYAVLKSSGWSRNTVDDDMLGGASWKSLAFDDDDRPNISYYDAHPADLKFARLNDGQWQTEVLAVRGAVGLYSTLLFDDDGDGDGDAHLLYYNRQVNEYHRLRGGFGDWTHDILETGGGRFAAATLAPDGDAVTYAWFETADNRLHVGSA